MSPAVRRLKRRPEFLRVAATRRKRVMPGLVLQAAPRGRQGAADAPAEIGVGFTASRKVGKAVARNRARRRLRAAAAQVLPELGSAGHDYVLVARAATLTRPYRDLVEDLRQALRHLGKVGGNTAEGADRRGGRPGRPGRRKEGGGRR